MKQLFSRARLKPPVSLSPSGFLLFLLPHCGPFLGLAESDRHSGPHHSKDSLFFLKSWRGVGTILSPRTTQVMKSCLLLFYVNFSIPHKIICKELTQQMRMPYAQGKLNSPLFPVTFNLQRTRTRVMCMLSLNEGTGTVSSEREELQHFLIRPREQVLGHGLPALAALSTLAALPALALACGQSYTLPTSAVLQLACR